MNTLRILYGDKLRRVLGRLCGNPSGRRAVNRAAATRAVWHQGSNPPPVPGKNRHDRRSADVRARQLRFVTTRPR